MANKRFIFGELNPVSHMRNGSLLDPNRYDGSDWISKTIRETRNPNIIGKLSGPLQGVCLKVESAPGESFNDSWYENIYSSAEDKPAFIAIRARIPEIHAYLPDPYSYGPEALEGMMIMYPLFISFVENMDTPAPGELVWLDYKNRETFEHPIYLGRVEKKVYSGGFETLETNTPSNSQGPAEGCLGLNAPTGDPIGQSEEEIEVAEDNEEANQLPSESSRCDNSGNVGGEPPESNTVNIVGVEPAYRSGIKLGDIKITMWTNPDQTTKKIPADMYDSLIALDSALYNEVGLRLYINSGFRTMSEQQELWDKYQNGTGNRAARPGFSNHQNGRAIDVAVYDEEATRFKRIALAQNQESRQWMLSEAYRFQLTWEEGQRINEPWHWNYTGYIEGSYEWPTGNEERELIVENDKKNTYEKGLVAS